MTVEQKEAVSEPANNKNPIASGNENNEVIDTSVVDLDGADGEESEVSELEELPILPDISMGKDPTTENVIYIDLDQIDCRIQSNVREENSQAYSDASIRKLANTIISANTLLENLVIYKVKPSDKTDGKSYKLNDGFRRAKALRMAHEITGDDKYIKAPFVRAIVYDVDPDAAKKVGGQAIFRLTQLISTVREDLEPLETAKTIEKVITESRGTLSQADVASILGVTPGKVSQYLKLLEAPEVFKKLLAEGKIPFSHIREMQSSAYNIDPNVYDTLAKLAIKWNFEAFKAHLIKNHLKNKPGEAKDSDSKGTKVVANTVKIKNIFIPYLKKRVESLSEKPNELKKEYTALDLEKARLDAIASTVNDEAALSKEVIPFEKELEEAAKLKEEQKSAEELYEKFISDQAKLAKNLIDLPINDETGERPYPSLTSALAEVHKRMLKATPEETAKFGFDVKDESKRAETLKKIHTKYIENKKLAKERAAAMKEAKAKKAAEKAAEKPASAEGGEGEKTKKKKGKKK